MRWGGAPLPSKAPRPALPPVALACEPEEPYGAGGGSHAPPELDLRPYTREELHRLFRGGEREADEADAMLLTASRNRHGIGLRLGQGLAALQKGRRLQRLAFRFEDYARELGIGRSRGYELAAFARDLETRPILREAVRSGRVGYRAAQEVVRVAVGAAEAEWVERAATSTVRVLEKEVARATDPHAAEPLFRMVAAMAPEHRALWDEALRIAGRLEPHASQIGKCELIAQEYLGEFPSDADELVPGPVTKESWRDDAQLLGGAFRRVGQRAELDEKRAAAMEAETDAWTHLPPATPKAAPEVDFAAMTSEKDIDQELRRLVRWDQGWDAIVGHRGYAILASRIYLTMGYSSFQQYVEERLQLPYPWVAERVKLEERVWASPGLQEGRRQKLGFEKLKLLSRLPENEIRSLIAVAKGITVIELRRRLEKAEETRMRGQGKLKTFVPRSVAYLLASAMATVRERVKRGGRGCDGCVDGALTDGECLAVIAAHFLRTYEAVARRKRSNSQRVRERDGGWCTVPGCSAHSDDAHHIEFKSQGGDPTAMWNQSGACRFHHVCVHECGLRLEGRAPDELVWTLDGAPYTGM
jgi:hypothetical protein